MKEGKDKQAALGIAYQAKKATYDAASKELNLVNSVSTHPVMRGDIANAYFSHQCSHIDNERYQYELCIEIIFFFSNSISQNFAAYERKDLELQENMKHKRDKIGKVKVRRMHCTTE